VQSPQISAVTEALEQLVLKSQELRQNDTIDYSVVAELDRQHREQVFEMISRGLVTEPPDLYHAAILLQHADPNTCRDCYLLAHHLARRAAELGHEPSKYMAAATLDRYLVFSGKPQKYGTQFNTDSLGNEYIFPIDSLTSDSERAVWNVPPFDSIIDRFRSHPESSK
jgi:hypothetical protein